LFQKEGEKGKAEECRLKQKGGGGRSREPFSTPGEGITPGKKPEGGRRVGLFGARPKKKGGESIERGTQVVGPAQRGGDHSPRKKEKKGGTQALVIMDWEKTFVRQTLVGEGRRKKGISFAPSDSKTWGKGA